MKILHLIHRTPDELVRGIIDGQRETGTHQVEEIDLTGDAVSYDEVVVKIFDADSVQSW